VSDQDREEHPELHARRERLGEVLSEEVATVDDDLPPEGAGVAQSEPEVVMCDRHVCQVADPAES
jgi:hypothetical protein